MRITMIKYNKRNTNLFLCLLFISAYFILSTCFTKVFAQVYYGNIDLSAQNEVDMFNYKKVVGSLTISEGTAGAITNLNGLSELEEVQGSLNIHQNTELLSLNGLSNLKNIISMDNNFNGSLIIAHNTKLNDISALNQLRFINGWFIIEDNEGLKNVDGLEKLLRIGQRPGEGLLIINKNNSLENLDGLYNLSWVSGKITITNNPVLTQYCGLFVVLSNPLNTTALETTGNALNPTKSDVVSGGLCPNIHDGDLYLGTQNAIDTFNYKSITGRLIIQENSPGEIKNLNGLSKLNTVHSELILGSNTELKNVDSLINLNYVNILTFYYSYLTDVKGLRNVNSVRQVFMYYNHLLTNVDGLNKIDGLARAQELTHLDIVGNEKLENINGLSGIISTGDVIIKDNPSLMNLDGFENLSTVRRLTIENNNALVQVNGLHNIKSVWYYLNITGNAILENVDGLTGLSSIPSLNILNNPQIVNVNGLENLEVVEQDLSLNGNSSLVTIQGLSKLNTLGNLSIANNETLTDLYGLNNLHTIWGLLNLQSNNNLGNIDALANLQHAGQIHIENNPALARFCGLYNFFNGGNTVQSYTNFGNSQNPTQEEIVQAGPCKTDNIRVLNAMAGVFTGDARLGTMTGSLNKRAVYFTGLSGGVFFEVNVPETENNWYIWGRMYYASGGGKNSFFVTVDGKKYVLGDNDNKYNQWHWDGFDGTRINIGVLSAGNHKIIISGREPGLTLWIDQLLLTNERAFLPEGFKITSNIITLNLIDGNFSGDARVGNTGGTPMDIEGTKAVFFQGTNGGVSFNLNLPASKRNWYVWGRMYDPYAGPVTTFYVYINNHKFILGNDQSNFNWHWDGNNGTRINVGVLNPGFNKLTIGGTAASQTLWIDQVILTDDPEFIPEHYSFNSGKIVINAMDGTFSGDARLGSMTGSINPRAVYFQGFNGGVTFSFNTPISKREWLVWARMYYMSSGNKNSFFIEVDDNKKVLGDNDQKYNKWHWDGLDGAKLSVGVLNPGEHTFKISAREPGLTLWVDQIIITDDPNFLPEDFAYSTNNILLNAMNGTFSGDARLGTMTGSLNSRCVYFQGLNGGVSFNANLPVSKRDWYIYGRMYCMSSGGKNSFYVSVDGVKYILGDNESKYDQWYWDGFDRAQINLGQLSSGNHTIIVSGKEPGLSLWIDQILLTDDKDFIPSDVLIKSPSEYEQQTVIPEKYELNQNYPNPFNPSTTIRFATPGIGNAELNIYDITGQHIKTIYSGEIEEGYHELIWDGTNNNGIKVHSGMYVCRLVASGSKGNFTKSVKMVLIK